MKQFQPKLPLIFIVIISLLLFIFFWNSYDIGLNSTNHVKKDFSRTFTARQNGDCLSFSELMILDKKNWLHRCIEEKIGYNYPISSFNIKGVSIRGNNAYLLVELRRNTNKYFINYQMSRRGGNWYIYQSFK